MSKRDTLIARAAALQLTHAKNISNTKLEALIKAAEADQDIPPTTHGQEDVQSGASSDPVASGPVVVIKGPKKGRRRAGYQFNREPVEIPLAELDEDQRLALIRDPKLTLQLLGSGEASTSELQGGSCELTLTALN